MESRSQRGSRPEPLREIISRPETSRNWGSRWNSTRSIWNPSFTDSSTRVVINQNFSNSIHYAYQPSAWGSRPWWCASAHHDWHRGSWNYGWNRNWQSRHRHYTHRSLPYYPPGYYSPYRYSSSLSWGLASWSLGSLIYDLGYSSYWNPYPAPPVIIRERTYTYAQPITVAALEWAEEVETLPLAEELSSAALERARAEFEIADYLAALKSVDEAIAHMPGDPAIHEFRALALFALGRYGDAAGVLHPLLASGPGWDWATLSSFYPAVEVYTGQLRRLEDYIDGQPEATEARFLLGYHYLVAGHLEPAYREFDIVANLQPRDPVAVQLRNLVKSSAPADEIWEEESAPELPMEAREIVAPESLVGTWQAVSPDGKTVTFALDEERSFQWSHETAGSGGMLSGTWTIDEDGYLVLTGENVQLVGDITLEDQGSFRFILAGSPEGDPGLLFQRQ